MVRAPTASAARERAVSALIRETLAAGCVAGEATPQPLLLPAVSSSCRYKRSCTPGPQCGWTCDRWRFELMGHICKAPVCEGLEALPARCVQEGGRCASYPDCAGCRWFV